MRIAGGWVRDRLLQKNSNDIDIAVTEFTGLEAATLLQQIYLKEYPDQKHHLSKISANPEASKHLESANFTQLRSEQYSSDSRIPQIQSTDSIVVDCLRRDLTINALYYNIETGLIEDYCGGLQDLQNKIIRTPLEPYKTLNEDPLRIIRVLRFKAKLQDYQINEELNEALMDKQIVDRLHIVAYERIHQEIQKGLIKSYIQMIKIITQYDYIYSTLLSYKQGELLQNCSQKLLKILPLFEKKQNVDFDSHERLILGITILSIPSTEYYTILCEKQDITIDLIEQISYQYKNSQQMLLSQSKDVKTNGNKLLYTISLLKLQNLEQQQIYKIIIQYLINNSSILNICQKLQIFNEVFQFVEQFYQQGTQIFNIKFKININDVAKQLGVTRKDMLQSLKNQFQLLSLNYSEYPQYNFNQIINQMKN